MPFRSKNNYHKLIMGKWCLQASSFLDWILVKLAYNQDMRKVLDKFEFKLDQIRNVPLRVE